MLCAVGEFVFGRAKSDHRAMTVGAVTALLPRRLPFPAVVAL